MEKPSKLKLHAKVGRTSLVVRVPEIGAYTTRAGNAPLMGRKHLRWVGRS